MSSANPGPRAVVFAYHNVGVRCIQTLLARGIEIALVVTHQDNPQEKIWFESVAELCQQRQISFITPDNANDASLHTQIAELAPDFIFSFYYRHMIPMSLLSLAKRGAYNLHGSLLPKYRGRVPVNWAVLHGESETGATLHVMAEKPDAGAIVAQTAVPILPDDTAYEVFNKLTVAAEQSLWQALPGLIAGTVILQENNLAAGSYYGGRKPEDGRIDWQQSAAQVYNLHRAVAPPYPGAFFDCEGQRFIIGKAKLARNSPNNLPPGLHVVDNAIFGVCGDGKALAIEQLLYQEQSIDAQQLRKLLNWN